MIILNAPGSSSVSTAKSGKSVYERDQYSFAYLATPDKMNSISYP